MKAFGSFTIALSMMVALTVALIAGPVGEFSLSYLYFYRYFVDKRTLQSIAIGTVALCIHPLVN